MWRMLFWTALCCCAVLGTDADGSRLRSQSRRDAGSHGNGWNYEKDLGPDRWSKNYTKCGGDRQSPINIITKKLDFNDDLDDIDFDNYDEVLEDAYMTNNGHTVAVYPGDDEEITIEEGGLDDKYQFVSLHFHWGSESGKGSEHTIDGKQFPLEMHLVHKNTNYDTMSAAKEKEDGIAVLSVLFETGSDHNDDLDPIIKHLDEVKSEGDKVQLGDFKLDDLLPDDLMPYYRYAGSLTTPTCDEAVIWTIFKDTVHISEKQIQKFRILKEKDVGEDEEPLANNFRPTQPINRRVVHISGEGNAATNIPSPTTTTIVLLALMSTLIFSRHF